MTDSPGISVVGSADKSKPSSLLVRGMGFHNGQIVGQKQTMRHKHRISQLKSLRDDGVLQVVSVRMDPARLGTGQDQC